MAKSSLLMRADTSGAGSSKLAMVLRSSLSSAWGEMKPRAQVPRGKPALPGEAGSQRQGKICSVSGRARRVPALSRGESSQA